MSSQEVLGVVGLGTVGSVLAGRAARAGLRVVALEPRADLLDAARRRVRHTLDTFPAVDGLVAGQAADAEARIDYTPRWAELAAAATVVEAVPERPAAKTAVLARLHAVCPPETVLVTSTSALSLTQLAADSGRPDRLVGLHLVLPASGVAELGRTLMTGLAALEQVRGLVHRLGLSEVITGDRPGLIGAALLFGYLHQATVLHEQGVASATDIDTAMRLGCGLPMGPFQMLDTIGIDTACDTLESLAKRLGEPRLRPTRHLRHMVLAGLLGRKSGRGFHRYDAQAVDNSTAVPEVAAADAIPRPGMVGIVGSGTMAAGIAEVFAASGWTTILIGRSKERALAAADAVTASLDRAVRRGRATEAQRSAVLDLLAPGDDPKLLAECDLVVEAVAEELDAKKAVFRTLGRVCRPGALLATTTSSLPVIACALASGRPEDVVGLHFFNPAPLMRLVEVVPTLRTTPERIALAHRICRQLGKHPVRCADRPGFLVNALLFPYLNEAIRMIESHYADAEAVDTVMRLGCGYPKGPLELLDIIGLDVSLSIQRTLHEAQGLPYSAPAALLGHLVTAGRTGRKAGAGFRVHTR